MFGLSRTCGHAARARARDYEGVCDREDGCWMDVREKRRMRWGRAHNKKFGLQ